MATMRTRRVAEEIQRIISERVVRGLKDPVPGFMTIREVEVNRDFTQAKIYYSIIGTAEEKRAAVGVLDQQKGYLRRELGQKVRLRNTPELLFIQDDTGERAARIHELLEQVKPIPQSDADVPSDGAGSTDE